MGCHVICLQDVIYQEIKLMEFLRFRETTRPLSCRCLAERLERHIPLRYLASQAWFAGHLFPVAALAEQEGYPIDQFLATAAAEKMAALRTLDYLRREAASGSREDFERFLVGIIDYSFNGANRALHAIKSVGCADRDPQTRIRAA
jgi:hypothetical protein